MGLFLGVGQLLGFPEAWNGGRRVSVVCSVPLTCGIELKATLVLVLASCRELRFVSCSFWL